MRSFLAAFLLLVGLPAFAADVLVVSTLDGNGVISGDLTGHLYGNGRLELTAPALTPAQVVAGWTGCGPGTPLLAYDGTCAVGGSPAAGVNGNVQFNNAGVFGADAGFNWDNTNKFLSLTGPSGAVITSAHGDIGITLTPGNPLSDTTPGSCFLSPGGGLTGNGGDISCNAGRANTLGRGGKIQIAGGDAAGTNQDGGNIDISAGSDTGINQNSTIALSTQGVIRQFIAHDGGITVGSPLTSQGAGTLNALGLYVNGVSVLANPSGAANKALMTPDGSSGPASLRSIVVNDLPLIPLATAVSGILPPSNGGTGLPAPTLGDTIYGNNSSAWAKLAGNTTATKQFLSQTGTGSVSAAPAWGALVSADIPAINLATTGAGGVTGQLPVAQGGTGRNTLGAHAALIGEGTSGIVSIALTADQLLVGQGAAVDPAAATLPNCGDATHALAYSTASHLFSCQAVGPTLPVTVANGGTGQTTLTAHGVLLGNSTGNVGSVAAMAADTLLQGQGTGADPAAVALSNCTGSTSALQYSTGTHTFGCQTITGSGATVTQVFKTGSTSRNNGTPTADPDLVFASVPAGNHTVTCLINWTNPATTGQLRYGLATSGSGTGWYSGINVTTAGGGGGGLAPAQFGANPGAFGTVATISTGNTTAVLLITGGVITTGTGNIQFGWSQLTTDAGNPTSVGAGSWCSIT